MPGGVLKFALLDEKERRLIETFIDSLGGIGPRRIAKYRHYCGKIAVELGKPLEAVNKKELVDYIRATNAGPYADSTKRDIRLITKKFFRWLHDPEFIAWLKIGEAKETVGPEDVLEPRELDALRGACRTLRNKALLETLYETAFRPHEFLSLTIRDVVFDDYGAVVHVRGGKTGGRSVRVINAAPLLANWIEHHPRKDEKGDGPLWLEARHNSTPLKWAGLKKVLEALRSEAGVTKRLHGYIFRHTRLTNLANSLTEAQLCIVAGWTQGSDMPRMYVHFSQRDTDDAILKVYGLKKSETREVAAPKKCVRCGTMNAPTGNLCSKCGMALTLTAAMKKDDEIQSLRKTLEDLLPMIEEIRQERKSRGKSKVNRKA